MEARDLKNYPKRNLFSNLTYSITTIFLQQKLLSWIVIIYFVLISFPNN